MHSTRISIWFFIGALLTVYGAMILGYGIYELLTNQTANVVLANLHAPVWWGGWRSACFMRASFGLAARRSKRGTLQEFVCRNFV
jgi:hypothetical protein